MSSRLFSEKMKISIRMVLVLQWVLAICALSSRDWLPPGYQWCQVRHISLIDRIGEIKWGASSRWSFGPISAWGRIETTTTGNTHSTLQNWTTSPALGRVANPAKTFHGSDNFSGGIFDVETLNTKFCFY